LALGKSILLPSRPTFGIKSGSILKVTESFNTRQEENANLESQ
jgi:hypothetical protein